MRRFTALIGAAAVVLWATSAFAQAKPNFAGKWTREAPAGGGAAAGGGGRAGGGGGRGGGGGGGFNCGMECTITQTAATLKVDRMQGEQTFSATFNLDGSDSKNSVTMGGRGGAEPTTMEIISKAKWDGDKLVISTTRDFQGTSITSTQTLSLVSGKLTVVSSSGREGATPQTTTYAKGGF